MYLSNLLLYLTNPAGSVAGPSALNLDPDPGCWPNLDQDPDRDAGLC